MKYNKKKLNKKGKIIFGISMTTIVLVTLIAGNNSENKNKNNDKEIRVSQMDSTSKAAAHEGKVRSKVTKNEIFLISSYFPSMSEETIKSAVKILDLTILNGWKANEITEKTQKMVNNGEITKDDVVSIDKINKEIVENGGLANGLHQLREPLEEFNK